MKLLLPAVLLALLSGPARCGEFYVGERVVIAPLELTVTNLKYSQGKGFDKPGQGSLFLMCDLGFRNTGSGRAGMRVRDMVSVVVRGDTVRLDTMRNFAANKLQGLEAGAERTVPVKFVVPGSAYEAGAGMLFRYGSVVARISLAHDNAFDGHLAAGIDLTEHEQYADALREYQAALGLAQSGNKDDHCYTMYRIGELFTRMFLYEEAVDRFGKVEQGCGGSDIAAEASGHVTALKERIAAETPKARAARLVECGFAYAFRLNDPERALAVFDEVRSGYAAQVIGDFTAGQAADLYTVNIHMNMKRFDQAAAMCARLRKGAAGAFAEQLSKMDEQIAEFRSKGE